MSNNSSALIDRPASHAESTIRRQAIRNFIQARVNDAATAEDLTQDVLVKAARAGHSLNDPTKIQGWILRIARNVIADHFRNFKKFGFAVWDGVTSVGPDIELLT